jgi:hypothetical protein
MLDKPQEKIGKYYDYIECCNYLQEKYKYDELNYAGKKFTDDNEIPYLNFWHWVIDNYEISNGCFITFNKEVLENGSFREDQKWAKEIYKLYIDEFADKDGELEMYVWW